MTSTSLLPSTAKSALNMERLGAVLFPHWLLWLVPNLVLALCIILNATSSRVEFIHFAYNVCYIILFSAMALMALRYARFHTFDWLLHRLWCLMLLALWVGFTIQCLSQLGPTLFALGFPLIDHTLVAADHALGFDWNAYAHLMYDHQWSNFIFSNAYFSFTTSGLMLTPIIAILRNDRIRLIQVCYLMLATVIACITISGLFPAYGAIGLADADILRAIELDGNHYLPRAAAQLHTLRDGTNVVFDMHLAEGLVCFPSFHCCMALIMAYCNRGLGLFSWLAYLTGIAIIASTPAYGGHYLVDLIGGGLVTLFFIVIWNLFILKHVSPFMPTTSAQAYAMPMFFKRLTFKAN
ncbi:MAG: phosphatase PAP2 family protein [Pseudomonadota bacterium]|nr:phosphatase PAP2 family protein [Pseudomonadota bacterium]